MLPGVGSFVGAPDLPSFLAASQVLALLLHLTIATVRIIDSKRLPQLPAGSYVINLGRGPLVVEEVLAAALEFGQITAAALNVFEEEPLPSAHPLWDDPRVFVTLHIASLTHPVTASVFHCPEY